MNKFHTDEELKALFGMRIGEPSLFGLIALFEPAELGWCCPKNKKHEIAWSEFTSHIWCYDCLEDFFTLLCPKAMNPSTTETILREETEKMAPLMSKWTIEKYKEMKR